MTVLERSLHLNELLKEFRASKFHLRTCLFRLVVQTGLLSKTKQRAQATSGKQDLGTHRATTGKQINQRQPSRASSTLQIHSTKGVARVVTALNLKMTGSLISKRRLSDSQTTTSLTNGVKGWNASPLLGRTMELTTAFCRR